MLSIGAVPARKYNLIKTWTPLIISFMHPFITLYSKIRTGVDINEHQLTHRPSVPPKNQP